VTELSTADEADSALTNLALLSGVPDVVADPVVEPAPAAPASGSGMPLHSAIPPLHLAA